MKAFIQYALVLFCITAVACAILAMVNQTTEPLIAQNKIATEDAARQDIFPGASFTERTVEGLEFYDVFDDGENLLGYILNTSAQGYSSTIVAMVGLNTDLSIKMVKVIDQQETPGLGTNCTKTGFLDRFVGLSIGNLKVDKDGGEIVSLTGATISTRALTSSIKEYIERLERLLPKPMPEDKFEESEAQEAL